MIDIVTEDLLPINKVPAELPNRPSVSTIWRWHLRGIAGVKLEATKVGGRKYTSREALARFFAATNAPEAGHHHVVVDSRRHEAAERELDEEGI